MNKKTTAKKINPKKTARKKTAPIKATTRMKETAHETKGPTPKNLDISTARRP